MPHLKPITLVAFALLLTAGIFSQTGQCKSVGIIALPAASNLESLTQQITATIDKQYDSTVEAVTQFQPSYLTGDFNGDGLEDLLAVVRLKVERSKLPKDVSVVNPFGFSDITKPNQSSSAEGEGVALCFAIVHGGKEGWRGATPLTKYLLLGGSPILILDHERVRSGETKNLMSLVPASRTRRSKYSDYRIPQTARGAWVLVSTQVGDGFIYWDGKTYRFKDSPQD